MTFLERIFDVQTGETIERPFNDFEIEAANKREKELQSIAKQQIEAAAAKAALLEKLGITEEEAKLLLS